MNTLELIVEMRPEKKFRPMGDLNPGLISTTSSVLFIAARSLKSHFFNTVHTCDFHIFPVIIRHLEGLFGSNIMTSSQLACLLSW